MKHKLIMAVLVCLVALLAITACSPDAKEPPPDVPQYSEGEAIAIVKRKVRSEMEILWAAHRARQGMDAVRARLEAKHGAKEYVNTARWAEGYLGQGKWVVTLTSPAGATLLGYAAIRSWHVYEFSHVVEEL